MTSKSSRKNPRGKTPKNTSRKRIIQSPKLEIPNLETPVHMTYWPVKDVLTMKRNRTILIPYYQRKKNVWDTKKSMKPDYIKSLLERQLSDVITLQQTPSGTLLCLNGQQRIDDMELFYKNKFAIPASVDPERADMKFRNLTEIERKTYLNYPIPALVQVSSNGKGKIAYIHGNTSIPIGKSELIKAEYYDTQFYKDIQSILRNQGFFKVFFYHSGVLSPAAIRRGKDEEFLGDCLLLTAYGACDGKEFVNKLSDFKRKASIYKDFKKENYTQKLGKYILTVNRIFPKGLKGTHFDNLSGCYRLLGAIRDIFEEGNERMFTKTKLKKISKKLVSFVDTATNKGRRGTAIGAYGKYYASISRSTRDKTVRLEGINLIRNQIMDA